jgi:hypothetical protein
MQNPLPFMRQHHKHILRCDPDDGYILSIQPKTLADHMGLRIQT